MLTFVLQGGKIMVSSSRVEEIFYCPEFDKKNNEKKWKILLTIKVEDGTIKIVVTNDRKVHWKVNNKPLKKPKAVVLYYQKRRYWKWVKELEKDLYISKEMI